MQTVESSGNSSPASYNKLARVVRIGKLYRLVRITKLLRLLKLFKSKGKIFEQINNFFTISDSFQRLFTTFLIFVMLAHLM